MEIKIYETTSEMAVAAARLGADFIRDAIGKKGEANIIVATGASQFEMLEALVKEDVDWTKVRGFHLDEYIGLPVTHPASFRKYLKERFVDLVPLKEFNYVNGENDPDRECKRLDKLIKSVNIDVAFIGIGENGHIAFNDPPADFNTDAAYITVSLDDICRNQQLGEGWFPAFDDVPQKAISMSIRQIMKSGSIICTVPDRRKAVAVRKTVANVVSPDVPATILKEHDRAWLFLDKDAASLLDNHVE